MSDLIVIPFLLLVLWKGKKSSNTEIFDINNTNALKGVFAIVVLFGHAFSLNQASYLFCRFNNLGAYACAVFFFISGYGLMYQYKNNDNYLNTFLRKRFVSILIPAITGSVIYILFKSIFIEDFTFKMIVESSLKGHTPIIDNSWFIIELSLLYLAFYLFFKVKDLINKSFSNDVVTLMLATLTIIMVIVIKLIGWGYNWYASILGFPLGLIIANNSETTIKLINKYSIKIIICSIAFIIGATYYQILLNKISSSFSNDVLETIIDIIAKLVFVMLIFSASSIFTVKNKCIDFISKISYELYIIHGLLIIVFNQLIIIYNDLLKIVFILASSIIGAYVLNVIDKKIITIINRN